MPPQPSIEVLPTPATTANILRVHWPLYLMEGAELALFMLSACAFTILLFDPVSPCARWLHLPLLQRVCMGVAMGLTAFLIIRSPMGGRSGAHFNPAITLTYLHLRKITLTDALGYVAGQFAGGIVGVALAALFFPKSIADPSVDYAVTLPGLGGDAGAFAAELFMAFLLMGVVLWSSNHPRLFPWTSYFVAVLIAGYIVLFAPVSGFSINPARTTASAVFAHRWTGVWIYFTAPPLGMMLAATLYLRRYGPHRVRSAKLHHASD